MALSEATSLTRLSEADEAFSSAGVYQAREHVSLLAPHGVTQEAGQALHRLRDLRDLAADGHSPRSPDYQRALAHYDEALTRLRTTMRKDIGNTAAG